MSSEGREIPTRRIVITDPALMPPTYSTTPGGTLYGTTPGGTRIVYDRAFLLQCRHSPAAQTPPNNLPKIPGVTCAAEQAGTRKEEENGIHSHAEPQRKEVKGKLLFGKELEETCFETLRKLINSLFFGGS